MMSVPVTSSVSVIARLGDRQAIASEVQGFAHFAPVRRQPTGGQFQRRQRTIEVADEACFDIH